MARLPGHETKSKLFTSADCSKLALGTQSAKKKNMRKNDADNRFYLELAELYLGVIQNEEESETEIAECNVYIDHKRDELYPISPNSLQSDRIICTDSDNFSGLSSFSCLSSVSSSDWKLLTADQDDAI